ncbi:MAG TPA: flagellar hook-basal body complex protein FliE [Rhodothermales bacterium]|nr:flagellar hook-basal body complex protein FliE [Rhodothermales bacterium]
MNISQLQRLRAGTTGKTDGFGDLPQPRESGSASFGDFFKDAIDQVDGLQKEANHQVTAFVAGEQDNVHDVMIAMNEARLSFQLMTEVRNKVMETYQELMRMQV